MTVTHVPVISPPRPDAGPEASGAPAAEARFEDSETGTRLGMRRRADGGIMPKLNVNGRSVEVDADPDTPLLWVLRDTLGLTGTKYGCGAALCGACTVHLDGQPARACQTPIEAAAGAAITTIEAAHAADGIAGRAARAVQAAWQALDVVQCGYCQSGQVMAAAALLAATPRPTDADVDAALAGNLCRCATYQRIRLAVHDAARRMEA
jgi:isoquinoline 1-oxidoreductase alpha subunit